MFKTRAAFRCKDPRMEPTQCIIEKVITLDGPRYDEFASKMHLRYDFIRDNTALMHCDKNNVYHCLLIVGENREDGILIQSEGANYARYTALMPHASNIITAQKGGEALAKLNRALIGSVDKIVHEALIGPPNESRAFVDIFDLEDKCGLNLAYNTSLINTICGMLDERPEVLDLELDKNLIIVYPNPSFMTHRETDSQSEQEDGEIYVQTMSL